MNEELLLFGEHLVGAIYIFAGKFRYTVLNKAIYEKVVEMGTK